MTLRNAFAEVMTEMTGRRILAALSFARDTADRMRVIVDNQPAVLNLRGNSGTTGVVRLWHDAYAVDMVDEREIVRLQSAANAAAQRNARWVYY